MAHDTPLLVASIGSATTARQGSAEARGWRLLGWVGLAFVVMGCTDLLLAWYPSGFGNPEWEFGAISSTLNGLALPTLGVYLVLSAAVVHDEHTFARIVGTAMVVLAAGVLILAFFYVTVVPSALRAVADDEQLSIGMQKAVIKAVMLFITYTALLLSGGVHGWRRSRRA